MAKKKKKDIPFHIAHNYKQWTSDQGYTFWAKDEQDAKLYLDKTEGNLGSLKEVDIPVDITGFEGTMDELDNLINIGAK